MRICLVHEEYPEETNFGGIATYQKAMAEELVKQGHTIHVICRSLTHDNNYIENGVNIYRIYVKPTKNQIEDYTLYRQKVAFLLLKLQNKNLIDIIEVPDWGAETIFFEENRKIPLVVRLHTPLLVWLKYNKNNFGNVKNKLLEWENKMINSANLITCCSSILKKIIVKEFNIEESKIIVTPNPANIVNFYRDNKIKKERRIVYVGSLEERKGVCVLAKALNIVLEKHPEIQIDFIGKDTTRNNKNISTQKYIKSIIDKKFKNNINFLGQLPNYELNKYLNKSLVGVYPSLFDNFPYVVLEAMATGLHIVGSQNSGMVEMLNDDLSIYKTGNEKSLAKKIIDKYELSLKEEICNKNIERVKEFYNAKTICKNMVNMYEDTIKTYYGTNYTKEELQYVLNTINDDNINKIKKEKGGVANLVFKIKTNNKTYIIKKYFYKYDFSLSSKLYNLYEKEQINIIKPLNKEPIIYRGFIYNVFEYKKPSFRKNNDYDLFLIKLLTCKRKTTNNSTITDKLKKYYDYLSDKNSYNNLPIKDVTYVLDISKKIINNKLFEEKYLNHGDISNSNIIYSKGSYYLIDFDETNVTTLLYDFAVIMVKMFFKHNKINIKKYNKYKQIIKQKYKNYSNDDFKISIEFYLAKILLEKYYLHDKGIINLFSKRQLKDNYKKYLKILKKVEKI